MGEQPLPQAHGGAQAQPLGEVVVEEAAHELDGEQAAEHADGGGERGFRSVATEAVDQAPGLEGNGQADAGGDQHEQDDRHQLGDLAAEQGEVGAEAVEAGGRASVLRTSSGGQSHQELRGYFMPFHGLASGCSLVLDWSQDDSPPVAVAICSSSRFCLRTSTAAISWSEMAIPTANHQ